MIYGNRGKWDNPGSHPFLSMEKEGELCFDENSL